MCNKRTATYCLSVPLFVHFSFSPMEIFFVKDFSATTWVRILKFGTKLDSDELYCVTKEQPHIAYQSFYLFIFLSLQWKFLSQISQLLLEPVFSNFVYIFRMAKCFVCFVALRPKSTAMVIAGRSVHLTTLFFLGKLEQAVNQ